jgi:4-amino-4-deoxy-L-arabinose transferase-like glycosyltransferase
MTAHDQSIDAPRSGAAVLAWVWAVAQSASFLVIVVPVLGSLFWDYDEGWFILGARFLGRGLVPFVDFIHHQPPLHLYLLAWCEGLFGSGLADYRLLSASSIAIAALVLFAFTRRFVGTVPALMAQTVFLFSPAQIYPLCVLPETPTAVFILLGAAFLFGRDGLASVYVSAAAFTVALLIKPTSGVAVLAATLSLVYARDWRRLAHFAAAGALAAAASLVWLLWTSNGGFGEVLAMQLDRAWTRRAGMWSVASGFADMKRLVGAETRFAWAVYCFKEFFRFPDRILPILLFGISLVGLPVWVASRARHRPALRMFVVLWPLAYAVLNFFLLDFVAGEKFTPFLAFSAFIFAGLAWLLLRRAPTWASASAAAVLFVALATNFAFTLQNERDPWYYRRAQQIADKYPTVVSFSPMLFAVTGMEPGCGFWNPINTYGRFGEAVGTESTQSLRYTDERLVECLRANPQMPVVLDWGFYFYTVPGSPLREYLRDAGRGQRVFLSREARKQWRDPVFSIPTDR